MHGLTALELRTLRGLKTPAAIQDFLDAIPMNFETKGDTCMSPRRVLREKRAHCVEGAMLAALALRLHGHPPLVMDLRARDDDDDHVVAVYKTRGGFGAISKTNHGTLRFRDGVYKTVRELAMSYFHEYTNAKGEKTLRSFSRPVDLSRFDAKGWMTAEDDVWYIPEAVDDARHYPILGSAQSKMLRKADAMERNIGSLLEWPEPR